LFVAGFLSAIVLAIWAGGEAVTQAGLRLAAAEAHYDWQAAPRVMVTEAAPAPARKLARR
jgi:hypothetical protein